MPKKTYPFDPLTPEEIHETAKMITERHRSENGWIFNSITLREPHKSIIPMLSLSKPDFTGVARKSLAVVIERGTGKMYEAYCNLAEGIIESFLKLEYHQPCFTPEDVETAAIIVQESPLVMERAKKVLTAKNEHIFVDPWARACFGKKESKRLMQCYLYRRFRDEDNPYSCPLNFCAIVDMTSERVVKLKELPCHGEFVIQRGTETRLPRVPAPYLPHYLPHDFFRNDLQPLTVTQPNGPSFSVTGHIVSWQKWNFHVGFNYRCGLVLHNVTYKEDNKIRPILYRAALSEMVVPCGDPRSPFHGKCMFDIGQYGLGYRASSLSEGCECLGAIHFFDVVLNNHNGQPFTIKNAICVHEEDHGILHRHGYTDTKTYSTRSRRLVVSFVAQVGNYDYAFYWYFYQDASIEFEVKVTGQLHTHSLAENVTPGGNGTIVFPQVNAQYHQHLFCVRLDTSVDGIENTVTMVDTVPVSAKMNSSNPYGNGITTQETVIKTTDMQSDMIPGRYWLIQNDSVLHPYTNTPVAYKLVPTGPTATLIAAPDSECFKRAAFAQHNLWVTPHRDNQLYATGQYVNSNFTEADGLGKWVQKPQEIVNKDIVVWYTCGITRIPSVEDFPIQSVEKTGFILKPFNFFMRNPALDVPPTLVDRKRRNIIRINMTAEEEAELADEEMQERSETNVIVMTE